RSLILKGSRPPDAREAPQPRRSRGARVQACGRDSCQNHARPMISLAQTAILLAAAVVAVSLFRFARLSSILGYLVAGLVIGPWGLNLIGGGGGILQVAERGQLKTQYGRGAFGILLFQDLAVLPALALLPMLAPSSATHAASGSWWITLLKLLAVIVAVIGGGRLLLRPALRVVARAQVS